MQLRSGEKQTTSDAEATFNTSIQKITPDGTIPTFTSKNANQMKHQFNTKAMNKEKNKYMLKMMRNDVST